MDHKNFDQWYIDKAHLYDSLAQSVVQILKSIMKSEKISFVDVPYRIKTKDSCLGKLKKKSHYQSYEDMTDIAGLRIITLVESDLEKVSKIISENFNVHKEDSGDKADLLGADKFGYRSIHFVCDIGKERERLPEFTLYKDLCFEIQIRTALSHAWAEIEHDRGYKLGGELPQHLKRRFNLLSGLLESADLEFNRLTTEIENYKNKLKSSDLNDLLDLDINRLSLISYLNLKLKNLGFNPLDFSIENFDYTENFVYQLPRVFGIQNINEIEVLWNKHQEKVFKNIGDFKYLSAPLFRIFMAENLEVYFNLIDEECDFIDQSDINVALTIYDKEVVDSILEENNYVILDILGDET
ncbi:hypothetical protein ABE366_14475 [Acinetobacter pittii]|uniref:GTP pyrophosphokinase n=1 Tax=Acinetobacter pittii TaxID=48296 RepID=UPI00320B6AB9